MRIKKAIMFLLGLICTALGAIGIFLPLLPTTPFILAAAICFSGSSQHMYDWLSRSPYFGEFINNYQNKTGVSKRTKALSILFLWSLLSISMYLMRDSALMIPIMISVGIGVTAHILLLRGVECASSPVGEEIIPKPEED
jgi:uncharacterized protein